MSLAFSAIMIVGNANATAISVSSGFDIATIVDCIAGHPSKTSYRYNGYYYSPQVIGYPDWTVRIGWYDSGNMVTPPGRIYDWLLISRFARSHS